MSYRDSGDAECEQNFDVKSQFKQIYTFFTELFDGILLYFSRSKEPASPALQLRSPDVTAGSRSHQQQAQPPPPRTRTRQL